MVAHLQLAVPFVLFPIATAAVFRFAPGPMKIRLFALVNLMGMLGLCLVSSMRGLYLWQLRSYLLIAVPVFCFYVLIVLVNYFLLRHLSRRTGWLPWLAFLFPLAVLLAVKYSPSAPVFVADALQRAGGRSIAEFFIGLSYMAFRLSHLALEVRNGVVPAPTLSEYVSFACFVPTLSVGPINPYSTFHKSLYAANRAGIPAGRSISRIIVGLTKYLFLATLFEQLSYNGLLRDGHPHHWIDLPIAATAFCFYLYLNFGGYCDMAVGTAGLLGIRVEENFDRPFRARNLQEFWTRWHMTLTGYFRDMVFSPLSRALARMLGERATTHAVAISILTVFLLMGAWHGLSVHFLIYGLLHGCGVACCHYYTVWLKRRLGKQGYLRYMQNPGIRAAATSLTFVYVVGTLFFFANSLPAGRAIFGLLR